MSRSFLDCGCCIVDGHRTFCPTCLAGPIPTEKSSKDDLIKSLRAEVKKQTERWEVENSTLKQVVEERNGLREELRREKERIQRLRINLKVFGMNWASSDAVQVRFEHTGTGRELEFKIPNEQAHQIKIGDELELIIQTKESD